MPGCFELWMESAPQPPLRYRVLLKFRVLRYIDWSRKSPLLLRHDSFPTKHPPQLRRFVVNEPLDTPSQLLWELYSEEPAILDRAITSLTFPLPRHRIYDVSLTQDLELIKRLFYPLGSTAEDDLATDLAFLQKLSNDMHSKFQLNDKTLRQKVDSKYVYLSPSWTQLGNNLNDELELHLSIMKQKIKHFLDDQTQRSDSGSPYPSEVDLMQIFSGIRTATVLLFAVSGTGKTQSIKSLLSRRFGFYFQPCSLSSEYPGLHDPRRTTGSRDTLHLFKILNYVNELIDHNNYTPNLFSLIRNWLTRLVACRYIGLAQFLQLAKDTNIPKSSLPRLWFDLQTCDTIDPFSDLFQISIFFPSFDYSSSEFWKSDDPFSNTFESALDTIRHGIQNSGIDQEKLYHCLDEAQVDAELRFPYLASNNEFTMLSIWTLVLKIAQAWDPLMIIPTLTGNTVVEEYPVIFSGTSLNIIHVEKTLRRCLSPEEIGQIATAPRGVDLTAWRGALTYTHSDFPLVKTKQQFWSIMDSQGFLGYIRALCTKLGTRAGEVDSVAGQLSDIAFTHGQIVHGRARWSVIYLQLLKTSLEGTGALQRDEFELKAKDAARLAADQVKKDLIQRLSSLKSRRTLMHDLCWAVIASDLLDRPTAFNSAESHKLITEAFACMEVWRQGDPKVMLKERLAVSAAKDFFLSTDDMRQTVEKNLIEFLNLQQHDASSLGKAAEWFLAWNLWRVFRSHDERLFGSLETHRLGGLLQALSEATPLNSNDPLDLSEYSLVEGDRIGHMYKGTVELDEWIRRLRVDGLVNATFYFPENTAGPDLLFALRRRLPSGSWGASSTILCALQLKCGDAELDKGEKTTDLTKAYVNRKSGELLPHYKKKREPLIQELDLWSKSKLRVLRVLVTAAVGDAGKRAPPAPGLGYGEYYIRCDASKGELMFGPQFTHLLAAVRKGGGDVLEAYRSDSDTYSSKRQRTK